MVAASTPAETTFTGTLTMSTAVSATAFTIQPVSSSKTTATAQATRIDSSRNHSEEKNSHITSLALIAIAGCLRPC